MYENINWKHNNQCPDVNFEKSLHIKTWRPVGKNKMNRFPETALQLCMILTEKVDGECSTRNSGVCEQIQIGKWISSSGNGGITDTNIFH